MQELLARAKALADPTRLKLLRLLMERECAVHELVDVLATGQSRVSQHLAKLKDAGLVQERPEGRQTYYAANPAALLGIDRALLDFLYSPPERMPEMQLEWQRWQQVGTLPAGEPDQAAGGAVPILFRPAPANLNERPETPLGRRKPRVLFLCTANSFRSQIAEAWTRALGSSRVEVQSAGLEPSRIHPVALAVMREVGLDMAGQHSKGISPEMLGEADVIVTLCGTALGWFPFSRPGVKHQHWPFPDPAAIDGPEDHVLAETRKVRDGIRRRVETLLAAPDIA